MRDTEQLSLRFARCSFAMNGALNGPLAKGLLAAGMDEGRQRRLRAEAAAAESISIAGGCLSAA